MSISLANVDLPVTKTPTSSSSRRQTTRRRGGVNAMNKASVPNPARGGSRISSVPADAMLIMRELAEARQDTIKAKDQLIQFLMDRQ